MVMLSDALHRSLSHTHTHTTLLPSVRALCVVWGCLRGSATLIDGDVAFKCPPLNLSLGKTETVNVPIFYHF